MLRNRTKLLVQILHFNNNPLFSACQRTHSPFANCQKSLLFCIFMRFFNGLFLYLLYNIYKSFLFFSCYDSFYRFFEANFICFLIMTRLFIHVISDKIFKIIHYIIFLIQISNKFFITRHRIIQS